MQNHIQTKLQKEYKLDSAQEQKKQKTLKKNWCQQNETIWWFYVHVHSSSKDKILLGSCISS